MNPYPSEGMPSQQRPDPYISRNAEFDGGRSLGSMTSMQQGVRGGFTSRSVITPFAQPNGQTQNDFQRSLIMDRFR